MYVKSIIQCFIFFPRLVHKTDIVIFLTLTFFLNFVFLILPIVAYFHLVRVPHDFVYTRKKWIHLHTHSIYSTRYLVKSPMSMFSTVSTDSRSS